MSDSWTTVTSKAKSRAARTSPPSKSPPQSLWSHSEQPPRPVSSDDTGDGWLLHESQRAKSAGRQRVRHFYRVEGTYDQRVQKRAEGQNFVGLRKHAKPVHKTQNGGRKQGGKRASPEL